MLEALKSATLVRKGVAMSYLQDTMPGNLGVEIILRLQEMYADEGSYLEMVRILLRNRE
jgi:hypothetical protein